MSEKEQIEQLATMLKLMFKKKLSSGELDVDHIEDVELMSSIMSGLFLIHLLEVEEYLEDDLSEWLKKDIEEVDLREITQLLIKLLKYH